MSGNGRAIGDAVAARRRTNVIAGLRGMRRGAERSAGAGTGGDGTGREEERCDLCGVAIPSEHEHLLHLGERRILCACATCWAQRSGDPELRPTGSRVAWLDGFELPDELWARLEVPIGLAFFMRSSSIGGMVAMYPSPAGATESELKLDAWEDLRALNPELDSLEPDAEALVVNRISEPAAYVIAPIDECYGLVGAIKASWEGISGGDAIERAVPTFFARLRQRSQEPR
ncbi:MAG TPA: DUF5947 family protein [Solirubrobacterales bacterium]|nr:DUF5947 family protein [Solirubrobacterales bacterium]